MRSIIIAALILASAAISPASDSLAQGSRDKIHEGLIRLELGPMYGAIAVDNFIVYYNHTRVDRQYALDVGDALADAWDYYKANRYLFPLYSDNYRVAVEIKKALWPGLLPDKNVLGIFIPYPKLGQNPYIQIKEGLSPDMIKGVCAHELFHFIEHAYDEKHAAGRWLWESNAEWAIDEVVPTVSADSCYLVRQPNWYSLWSEGLELNKNVPQDARLADMAYGSAIFFKYLTEHHPKGQAIVKEIWEDIKNSPSPSDAIQAIRNALGEAAFGFDIFGQYFIDFCTAVYLKTHKEYGFRRGNEILGAIIPKARSFSWHYTGHFSLKPLSAVYFEFWLPSDLKEPAPFRLILKKSPNADVMANVIKLWAKQSEVEDVTFTDNEAEKTIQDFGPAAESIQQVTVAVSNPSSQMQDFDIAAVIGEPPYLKEIEVYKDNMSELIYHAKWEDSQDARTLSVIKNSLELKEDEKHLNDIDALLTFSRRIGHLESIRFENLNMDVVGEPSSDRTLWRARLPQPDIDKRWKEEGHIQMRVLAKAPPEEMWLDANPATIPYIDKKALTWNSYEAEGGVDSHKGGIDETHKINLNIEKKPDEKPKPAVKEEKPSAVKKFFVDSIFSKTDAERVSPHLIYFTVAGEKKDGLLSKDADFTYNTPHSQSASYGIGWWYDYRPKVDELVLYDATVSITFTHFNPSDPIPSSGLKKNLAELVKANPRITKMDPRGLPLDEAYGMEGENSLYFYGISQNSYLYIHIFHRVHGTVTGVPQNLNELAQKIFERIRLGMDNIAFVE